MYYPLIVVRVHLTVVRVHLINQDVAKPTSCSVVFLLELLVLVALLRVEIVETSLVSKVNIIDLLLVGVELVLHITLFGEKSIQVSALLIVLVLDMHVERLNVLRLSIAAMLIQGQVVVGQVTLELADVLNQSLILALERQVGRVVLVDIVNLLLHLVDLSGDVIILVPQQVHVVVAIVDLTTRANALRIHTRQTVVCHGTVNRADLSVVSDTAEVYFPHCGTLAHSSAKSSKLHD